MRADFPNNICHFACLSSDLLYAISQRSFEGVLFYKIFNIFFSFFET